MLDRDMKIQEAAYAIWASSGYVHGDDWHHWLEAEKQVDQDALKSFKPKKPRAKKVTKAA